MSTPTPSTIGSKVPIFGGESNDGNYVTLSSSNITALRDRFGYGISLTQTTTSYQPVQYVGINGLKIMRFDGSDDELNSNSSSLNFSGDVTVLMALKPDRISTDCPLGKAGATNKDWLFQMDIGFSVFQGTTDYADSTYTPPVVGNPAIVGGVWNQTTQMLYNYVDGTKTTGTNHSITRSSTTQAMYLGARYNGTQHYLGDVYEVLLFDRVLSDIELDLYNTYLRNKWFPHLPSGLKLWLDAADSNTITLNGSNVSAWADKSGNGLEFTMSNSSYQPAYTENAINSLSALNFDGTNDYIRIIDTTLLKNASEYTIFAIINYNTSNIADILSVTNSSGEHGFILELNNTNAGSIRTVHRHPYSVSGGDGILTGGSVVSSNTTYSIRIETSVTSGNQKLYVNDVLEGEDTSWSATTFDANHNVYLGILGTAARFYKQYIGEIIIYESIPNSTEIDKIENYLAKKWGMTT